ncbi:hypothetical protein SUGI_1150030 [Cryptomeria japonica]|nr:hypothetical protein SUGI_1150030 [Cryptomeria japonica]
MKRIKIFSFWDNRMQIIWDGLAGSINNVTNKTKERSLEHWKAHETGRLKMNFDGATKGNLGRASVGCLIRDEQGQCVGALAMNLVKTTHNEAKLATLMLGLKLCKELDVKVVTSIGIHNFALILLVEIRLIVGSWGLGSIKLRKAWPHLRMLE